MSLLLIVTSGQDVVHNGHINNWGHDVPQRIIKYPSQTQPQQSKNKLCIEIYPGIPNCSGWSGHSNGWNGTPSQQQESPKGHGQWSLEKSIPRQRRSTGNSANPVKSQTEKPEVFMCYSLNMGLIMWPSTNCGWFGLPAGWRNKSHYLSN